jgi:hypothetical protein
MLGAVSASSRGLTVEEEGLFLERSDHPAETPGLSVRQTGLALDPPASVTVIPAT